MTDKIENIVAIGSIDINERIDLNKLANKFNNVEFDPIKFPRLVIKHENPEATILIFSTGKMVLTGLKKENDVQKVFNIILESLNNIGVKYMNSDLKIKKIISRDKVGRIKITDLN